MSAPTMGDKATLAQQCMDFCQHMDTKGKTFKFSLVLGSDFTFTLDTREEATTTKKEVRKKLSPSSVRRNARRKAEFLKRKNISSDESPASSEKESDTSEKSTAIITEKDVNVSVDLDQPVTKQTAEKQPWRRPSSCRRCGLPTRGHPGPYGEQRCRVSLHHLPSRVCVMKCSPCMDHPNPPCNDHRNPWTGPGPGMDTG